MKTICLALFLLLSVVPMAAQECPVAHKKEMAQMQEERIEYIAKELQLTAEEQKTIGEALVRLDEEKVRRYRAIRQKRLALEKKASVSKGELLDYLQFRSENKCAIETYEQNTLEQLAKSISPEKVLKLETAKRKFLREFHKKRRQRMRVNTP